jgi:spore coat polysaccharide biosynthesis protein SpsF
MKTGVIVQARAESTRLPGKVLKELPFGGGISVLKQVIRRLGESGSLQEIIVATTNKAADDEIVEIAEKEGVRHFRGSEEDVLSRYFHAARENSLHTVARVTSDCPCIDPQIVDFVVKRHFQENTDYTSNTLTRTYPHGLDCEVFSFKALEKSFAAAGEDFEREHVTPYIYRSGSFKIQNIEAQTEMRRPDIRITLDTKEDYALLCAVYDFLYHENPSFKTKEVIGLFDEKPWLKHINERVVQKKIFDNLEDELKEAVKVLELQDLRRARDFIRKAL